MHEVSIFSTDLLPGLYCNGYGCARCHGSRNLKVMMEGCDVGCTGEYITCLKLIRKCDGAAS